MRTVFASLPFYDSLAKQDVNRSKAIIPIHCPRTQLPPFLINLGTESVATVTSVTLVDINGSSTDISTYFDTLPDVYDPTDASFGSYIMYKGDILNTLLPLGVYYVKIANGEIEYYSDYIRIENIYSNLVTGWTNATYETFSATAISITAAIETGSSGQCNSTQFLMRAGESIKIPLNFTLNSGAYPGMGLIHVASTAVMDFEVIGVNTKEVTLTATKAGLAYLYFYNGSASNWTSSYILPTRTFASDTIRIDFSNTKNIGDLLYENSFSQTVWLEAILNNPSHEFVEIGEEKDGVFISEKVTSKYLYSVIAYVSRGLYQCLVRLRQHDTITITDEVGNTYTPKAGNVLIESPEWTTFETCRLVLKFNDNEYSAFNWVK